MRTVGLPREHGGWSLTFEPALLGMLVKWSGSALALSAVALLMFTARTPLKYALVDRTRDRRLPRTVLAERLALAEIAIILLLVAVTTVLATGPFLWPFAAAAPLLATGFWYDIKSRSRHLVPELAGTVGIAAIAAAIVIAGGGTTRLALAMWLVAASRSVASVVFVRVQINRSRSQPHRVWHSNLAQVGTVGVLILGVSTLDVPIAAVIAMGVAATFQLIAARRPVPKVAIVGAQQMAIGLGVVFTTALGVLSP